MKPPLYIVGTPGPVGGASTKIVHLLRLLSSEFNIILVTAKGGKALTTEVEKMLRALTVKSAALKDLPKQLQGVALCICVEDLFSSGLARSLKDRGLRIVWSNEMMFPFVREVDAVRDGLIDRVLYVSELQAREFECIHRGIPSFQTGNFIDPEAFPWVARRNATFTIGRLSRPDPDKFPSSFPVFYEELGLDDVRYRVMAWSEELRRRYRWHRFGPEWDLLPANKEAANAFLSTLDLLVYPLGHQLKESWGRAVVEAMLTGCVPIVPSGHSFHELIKDGENGYICSGFNEFKTVVQELRENYPLRMRVAKAAAEHARIRLCNPMEHRRLWTEALTF